MSSSVSILVSSVYRIRSYWYDVSVCLQKGKDTYTYTYVCVFTLKEQEIFVRPYTLLCNQNRSRTPIVKVSKIKSTKGGEKCLSSNAQVVGIVSYLRMCLAVLINVSDLDSIRNIFQLNQNHFVKLFGQLYSPLNIDLFVKFDGDSNKNLKHFSLPNASLTE